MLHSRARLLKVTLYLFISLPGRILNRFSKDVGLIDEVLPLNAFDFLQVMFHLFFKYVNINYFRVIFLIATFSEMNSLYKDKNIKEKKKKKKKENKFIA